MEPFMVTLRDLRRFPGWQDRGQLRDSSRDPSLVGSLLIVIREDYTAIVGDGGILVDENATEDAEWQAFCEKLRGNSLLKPRRGERRKIGEKVS